MDSIFNEETINNDIVQEEPVLGQSTKRQNNINEITQTLQNLRSCTFVWVLGCIHLYFIKFLYWTQ